jgi:predicted DNA-binding transcriptional regulator AlpA
MSAAEKIPFELLALNAEQVGQLLGMSARTVLEKIACRPDFPDRVSMKPASWVAGEVLAWRDANRASARARRRRPRSRT